MLPTLITTGNSLTHRFAFCVSIDRLLTTTIEVPRKQGLKGTSGGPELASKSELVVSGAPVGSRSSVSCAFTVLSFSLPSSCHKKFRIQSQRLISTEAQFGGRPEATTQAQKGSLSLAPRGMSRGFGDRERTASRKSHSWTCLFPPRTWPVSPPTPPLQWPGEAERGLKKLRRRPIRMT